ncbi:MAG: hypothetical protein JO011_15175, partial [Ktedonobacteraceae bacterium]|nr:hypothetical protein [Ktedonobacteraceae bacterium]
GLTLDQAGDLYVDDYKNNRVLYYAAGSTTATRVYGQGGSFTSSTANNGGISATSLSTPMGLNLDQAGNLYVDDYNNNRVLYYPSGSTTATRVYGQGGDFTSNTANNGGISATSISNPFGVNVDSSGNIYVTDRGNSRVLKFQTRLSTTTLAPSVVAAQAPFSAGATMMDMGSLSTFSDFTGTVTATIQAGSGTSGAVLGGTTSVSASNGVATFSNLTINLGGTGYIVVFSSTGAQSDTTNTIDVSGTPAGYWPFSEESGTTTADLSGNNNTGTITGATWTSGEISSGLSFNGSSNYVTMGSPSTLKFGTSNFTIMAWFKTTSTSYERIVDMGLNSWNNGFDLGVNVNNTCVSTGCVAAELGGGGSKANSVSFGSTSTFNDGKWHLAAMVVNQTAQTMQLYVDGVAQTPNLQSGTCGTVSGTTVNIASCTSTNATSSTDPFDVGADRYGSTTGYVFSGSIDEVRAYNYALDSALVQNQYNSDVNTLSEYAASASFSGTVGSTATYTLPISLTYQLTPAPGWSLSITSTTLTSGSNTLPTTASNITAVTGVCTVNGTCSSNTLTNNISVPMALPAGATAPTAVKFFSTASGTGTGAYTVTPTISVAIPATAKPGTYTSTMTLSAVSGP